MSPGGVDENPGLLRMDATEGPGSGVRILNQPPPAPLKESVRCAEQNLYVFTINGFPYGCFHGARVKENVYVPDWRTPERRDYTNLLADILADLLPRNLTVQIFRVLLENAASFYGSQMTAMDSASRNAGDVIKDLTLQMNRSRQASITKELIEIISGAEAI